MDIRDRTHGHISDRNYYRGDDHCHAYRAYAFASLAKTNCSKSEIISPTQHCIRCYRIAMHHENIKFILRENAVRHNSRLSPREIEALKQSLRENTEKQTPLPGNICKSCNGEVVKKVNALFRGKFYYSFPECNTCGRVYFYASNARAVGEEAFRQILEQPLSI